MRYEQIVATLVISLLAGTLGAYLVLPSRDSMAVATHIETALERVNKTGKLRCGYIEAPPYFVKDPNTGAYSGLWYELTEKIAELAGVQVVWTAPTSYATVIPDLKAGKFDAYCSAIWSGAKRAKEAIFSMPLYYSSMNAYARMDEQRFIGKLEELNKPAIKFVGIDGSMEQSVRQIEFPESSELSLPQTADITLMTESVATGKADVVISSPALFDPYDKSNPGKLKKIPLARPLRVFEETYMVLPEDHALRDFLNTAGKELLSSGFVEKTLQKYEVAPGEFLRAKPPYEDAAGK
ncbi:MAG: transporter substrate-binding domain-containing protein [Alphaproteobacteria bacterium]